MNKIKFEKVCCNFCDCLDFSILFHAKDHYHQRPGLFTVVRCKKCGLVYTNPRPIPEDMPYYYSESAGYYNPQIIRENPIKFKIKCAILQNYYGYFPKVGINYFKKGLLFPLFLLSRMRFKQSGIPAYTRGGSLLDIGCSYGGFLYDMRRLGWNVKGLEMNDAAAEWGRKNLSLDIINTNIDSFETNETFHVITMRMLLEHVYSPKAALSKISKMLKPGGQLIISVPDFDGMESKLYNKYSYTIQVPTHLTHFTPRSIKRYLRLFNFKNIKIYHQSTDRDLIAPLDYMRRENLWTDFLHRLLSIKIIRKTLVKIFVKSLSFLGKTSRMVVYARK